MTAKQLHIADALGHEASDKRLDILRRIGTMGSISEAARGAGVSYKAAWQAIDTLSNLAGVPLLERTVGGSGGGGASLTPAAEQLLHAADLLNRARAQVLASMASHSAQVAPGSPRIGALGLRTSMRNQFPCVVKALKTRGQAIQVELALGMGAPLFSRITRESAELLGLQAGQEVVALCKATAVTVAQTPPALRDKADSQNVLPGQVTRASRAAAGGEVALSLGCGLQLVGFCGPQSGLRTGSAAVALVHESAIVVALAG